MGSLAVLGFLVACGVLISAQSTDSSSSTSSFGIPSSRFSCTTVASSTATAVNPSTFWPNAVRNLNGSRWNPNSHITAANANTLTQAYAANIEVGAVVPTPAYWNGRLFFSDIGGNLFCLNATTGAIIWQQSGYPFCRSTPNVAPDVVIFGTQGFGIPANGGAKLWAFNTLTGAPVWNKTLNNFVYAGLTQSGTRVCNILFIGTSSIEEGVPTCCNFVGQFFAIDVAANGAILWSRNLTNSNFPGVATWGSSPAVDLTSGTVYITTGDIYEMPPSYKTCLATNKTPAQCIPSDVLGDAIIALDIFTGNVKWNYQAWVGDAWFGACEQPGGCPQNPWPLDYDFAQGPMVFTTPKGKQLVGAGSKGGIFYALNTSTGQLVWKARVGPGGLTGGMQWGSATDGTRVYVALVNSNFDYFQLPDASKICYGAWAALDAECGSIVWMTPDPSGANLTAADCAAAQAGNISLGKAPMPMSPVTVANGVVFSGTLNGFMYGFDASSGKLVWQFAEPSGASFNTAPSIIGDQIFFGSGYPAWSYSTAGTTFYSFKLP